MIGTVLGISVWRLWNNKQELLLALLVPILFFSIFAMIFGHGLAGDSAVIKLALVNDDGSSVTDDLIRLIREQPALRVDTDIFVTNPQWPIQTLARAIIRERNADVVLHFPSGIQQKLERSDTVVIQLFHEGTNPVARQIADTLLTQLIVGTLKQRQQIGSTIHAPLAVEAAWPPSATPARATSPGNTVQRIGIEGETAVSADHRHQTLPFGRAENQPTGELISVREADVFADAKHNPKIAMYAAGIAVMFLLFSATGAGGSLLEEYEAGTLDRLLASQLTITQLLTGKWLFITGLGIVQLTVMFVWAQLAFGVDLSGHLHGFAAMTVFTAAATASVALCLAASCRSRTQLNGVSIVLILTMSALGGSMVPRYIMSDEMRRWGQWTFNAWALDGFKKVFWYDMPVAALQDEIRVLLFMTVTLACLARVFAGRWSTD